ncbi:MAG: PLD nuclease N-terminal domain-containing protein [Oscillospiraceae bacterium]|nr:PLD nuclease N-terminal domain-containing protein [Oscillospiraceae bacterium]
MEILADYLIFILPLALIQLGLMVGALVHILTHNTYRTGNRAAWLIVCLFISVIGPIIYFCFGRGQE